MKVFIGYDKNEDEAFEVAKKSLFKHSQIQAEPLEIGRLTATGLIHRLVDERNNQPYDLPSNAPCSTEFAASRFLVPIICQTGWALFTDCDMVFMGDVRELLKIADPSKAVMVVKHQHEQSGEKMGGLKQVSYPRKNWSSVMLFNCDHPANRRLTLEDISRRPGRDLHAFYWLHDLEIGELPAAWNWLVGVQDKPDQPKIAHFTLGGPWIKYWQSAEHDDIWLNAAK